MDTNIIIRRFVIIYLMAVNLIAFVLYYADKIKARRRLWRIPEATLLTVALIGGSVGAYAAMRLFRHKTKHPKFYILVPLMIVLHIIILVFTFNKLM